MRIGIRRAAPIVLALVLAPIPTSADLPDPGDTWTEFGSAPEAMAAGWFYECGLSQAIVVDADCQMGAASVGCRAQQPQWIKRFGLRAAAPLQNVTAVRFHHRATWTELDQIQWMFFVTMETTPAELAAGYDLKQIVFRFDKAETWTLEELDLADGEWQWRQSSNGMWFPSGGTTELTTLASLEWYMNNLIFGGIAVGDMMLIDDLTLVTGATSVPPVGAAPLLRAWPNPASDAVTVSCRLSSAANGRLVVFDPRGRRVRELASGWLADGWTDHLWDGRDARGLNVAAGVYRVVLEAGGETVVRQVTLVR